MFLTHTAELLSPSSYDMWLMIMRVVLTLVEPTSLTNTTSGSESVASSSSCFTTTSDSLALASLRSSLSCLLYSTTHAFLSSRLIPSIAAIIAFYEYVGYLLYI